VAGVVATCGGSASVEAVDLRGRKAPITIRFSSALDVMEWSYAGRVEACLVSLVSLMYQGRD
jgi:hypothetical protein